MKILIFIFGILFSLILSIEAQDKVYYMGSSTYQKATFTSADTISSNDTLFIVEIDAGENQKTTQNFKTVLDSVSGTPTVDITLQGRVFDGDTWNTIGSSVSWTGTSGDTTIYITNTTANRYRQYRWLYDATTDAQKSTITSGELKLWRE